MARIKATVSILAIGVIVGLVAVYALLFQSLGKTTEIEQLTISQLNQKYSGFEDVLSKNFYNEYFFTRPFSKNFYDNFKASGGLCLIDEGVLNIKGTKLYFSDGKYVKYKLFKSGEDVVFEKTPYLLESYYVSNKNFEKSLSPNAKSVFIFINALNEPLVSLDKCDYELKLKDKKNAFVVALVYEVEGNCNIKIEGESYEAIVNVYDIPYDEKFFTYLYNAYINGLDFPQYLYNFNEDEIKQIISNLDAQLGSFLELYNGKIMELEKIVDMLGYEVLLLDEDSLKKISKYYALLDEEEKEYVKAILNSNVLDANDLNINIKHKEEVEAILKEIDKSTPLSLELSEVLNKYSDKAQKIVEDVNVVKELEQQYQKSLDKSIKAYYEGKKSIDEVVDEIKVLNPSINAEELRRLKESLQDLKATGVEFDDYLVIKEYDIESADLANTIQKYNALIRDISYVNGKDFYSACINQEKLERLKRYMDMTGTSFSYDYSPNVAYKRLSSYDMVWSQSQVDAYNKILDDLQTTFSLNEEEAKKAIYLFLLGKPEKLEDLLDYKEQLIKQQLNDYAEILDKMLSLESLTDEIVRSFTLSIASSFGGIYLTQACSSATAYANMISFSQTISAYDLFAKKLSVDRIAELSGAKYYLEYYGQVYEDLKSIDDVVNVEGCKSLLNIKDILRFLNAYRAKSSPFIGDYVSLCAYKGDSYALNHNIYGFASLENSLINFYTYSLSKKYLVEGDALHLNNVFKYSFKRDVSNEQEQAIANILSHVYRKAEQYLKENYDNEFKISLLSCGSCDYLPNPLRRVDNESLKQILENELKKYESEQGFEFKLLNINIEEQVKDESSEKELPCLCDNGKLKVCETKYVQSRDVYAYVLVKHKHSGYSYAVLLEFHL